MRFVIAGEGLTDFIVLQNLLRGFFNDKNLPVSRLHPENTEPAGWGNLFNYLATETFRTGIENTDYAIVQIDSGTCQDWKEDIKHIGDDDSGINECIKQITGLLIKKIGSSFYELNKQKIIFAISIHDIECWLLPFHSDQPAKYAKIVGCVNAIEQIAKKNNLSIHQKYYQDGKSYETLSKDMRNHKELMKKYTLSPSLKIFIDTLFIAFPPAKPVEIAEEPPTSPQ